MRVWITGVTLLTFKEIFSIGAKGRFEVPTLATTPSIGG